MQLLLDIGSLFMVSLLVSGLRYLQIGFVVKNMYLHSWLLEKIYDLVFL